MSKRLRSLIMRARLIIEETEYVADEYPLAYEIYVFDFDQTLQHKYKPLPCVDMMREDHNRLIARLHVIGDK